MTFLCFETLATVLFQLIASVCNPIDMALKLLKHYPSLATALDMRGESPVLALACMSFAYPSGNQLIFWKQWIYHREYYSLFVLL